MNSDSKTSNLARAIFSENDPNRVNFVSIRHVSINIIISRKSPTIRITLRLAEYIGYKSVLRFGEFDAK